MRNRWFFLITFTVLFSMMSSAQQEAAMETFKQHEWQSFKEFVRLGEDHIPDTNIDVNFYYLDLYIAIDSPYIAGEVQCRFSALADNLDQIWLSLNSALTVDDVTGNTSSFTRTGDSILIMLDDVYAAGEVADVFVSYHGVPALAGGYKGLRYETHHGSEPIIATLSTPYLAHYWYPCKDGPSDKPDSVYIDITIPHKVVNGQEVIAVSNGVLENIIDNTTEKTYQWRHRYPVVPYYVMAAISNFVKLSEDYTGIYGEQYPLDYYVFQQDVNVSLAGVEDMPLALDVFSEKFGEYPFSAEKYGMTQLGFYGAIENQTNTITNNMTTSWFNVSVHELGHMWFGDMITCKNWHHAWLNEGFASYSEAVYHEAIDGFTAYKAYMNGFQYWNGGTLYLENANDTFNVFQGIIYNKGAYVLHMLRGVLGDSTFFDCLYTYSTDPALMYKQAVTEDLQQICEDVSGEELDYFFEQWVYDEYYPNYHFNFENNGDELNFVIKQVQGDIGRRPVFEMPVEVKLLYEGGGDTTVRVWNDAEYQVFTVPVSGAVSMMQIDPGSWILDESSYHPEIPVGLSDLNAPMEIVKVYPNPAKDHITLVLSSRNEAKHFEITLSDIQGRVVRKMQSQGSGTHTFDLSELRKGTYLISLADNNGNLLHTQKVLVVR